MAIGEFSERSGLSAKRLRTYAAEGLLAPAAVDPGSGYRYYSPGQLADAQVIDALRESRRAARRDPLIHASARSRNISMPGRDSLRRDANHRQGALDLSRQLFGGAAKTQCFRPPTQIPRRGP